MISLNKYRMTKSSNPPLNFWSIVVYIWIFCLYMILFKSIGEIILFLIDYSPLKDFKDNTIGYGSPIFYIICFIYEYLLSSWYFMVGYAIIFTLISFTFIILWVIYHVLKIPIIAFFTQNLYRKSPFKDIMKIIDLLDRKSMFTDVLKYYRDELIKVLMNTSYFKSILESNPDYNEKFTNDNNIVEEFASYSNNNQYITEDLRDELKDKYKEKNLYYIEAFRHNSHKKSASLYKGLKIQTPLMDDNVVAKLLSDNMDIAANIEIQYFKNFNNIK
jgi:hypothetical protein